MTIQQRRSVRLARVGSPRYRRMIVDITAQIRATKDPAEKQALEEARALVKRSLDLRLAQPRVRVRG